MTEKELAYYFDHTFLKAFATRDDFEKLCLEAKSLGCHMVAINSYPVKLCKELLHGTSVHVGAAISFPLGQMSIEGKLAETEIAINDGADEIDYVVNVGKVKEHDYKYIEEEMSQMVSLCRKRNVLIKVIFENCYLTDEEKVELCHIAKKVEPDFIKTSTGFGTSGATVEDVKLMVKEVGDKVAVKAAGSIRDWPTCKAMIEAGAKRIGTSSSVKIIEDFLQNQ